MTFRLFLPAAATLALAGCAIHPNGPAAAVPLPVAMPWRLIVTRDDHIRLSDWRKVWVRALTRARPHHAAEIAAEGPLLDPDAALPEPTPPRGDYRCRTIKLGGTSDFTLYPPARCRIDAGPGSTLTFFKLSGAQRPMGRIFPENSRRMVFIGTLQIGDEPGTLRYGHDKARDAVAWVERVGDRRWRMAFPSPHFESTIDVIELVPGD